MREHQHDDDPVGTLEAARATFARFAAAYPQLPLYSAICRAVAEDDECATLLLSARPGQARPALFLAALHDLVLADPSVPAARWYATVVGRDAVPQGDPWPDVRATLLERADTLRETISTRSTQTNEVGRATYLGVALALAAADVDRPVALLELGPSAGLLLGVDRYDIELETASGSRVLGMSGSPVRCRGALRMERELPPLSLPCVVARAGLDLDPVDLDDPREVRWLEACLWPDVPGRAERFVAAVESLRAERPSLHTGDLVDDLPVAAAATTREAAAAGHADAHLVAFSSWALTYVRSDRRPRVAEALGVLAAGGRPVTWLTAEPPGCAPGIPEPSTEPMGEASTVLGMRRWRDGRDDGGQALGWAHPHGEWVALG